jgi:8-oxo-dGTP pyrophosphatase MutT (NUDIX family)
MKLLLENWRELKEKARGPADFHYKVIDSPLKKEIQVLDLRNKQPLLGKAKGDAKIVIEKRTDVPHWQVTWSNSPEGTEGIGTIMYLMAMELAGNEGFSPDDYEQSDDALRVWAKFMPKDNIHGISKEKKEEFKYEGDENPFFFVFFKADESVLRQFSVQISHESVEKPEIPPPEEDIRPFDPEDPEEWEFLDDLQESLDENDTENVSKVLIFNKNDEILLLKRADKQQNWDLPGGHIQKDENFVDGAKRETKEETNLDISGLKPVKTDEKDRIVKYFKANKYDGKISLDPEEHMDYKWVKIEDLDQYTVIKRMKSVIEAEMKATLQEIGRYQKKIRRKHRRMKIRLIGKGKNKHNVGKKMKKPSYKRSKSAPPGAGGT